MIPFSKTTFDHYELREIKDCFQSGWVVLGPRTAQFEENFAKYIGAKYCVFVDSGTAALSLAIHAVGYKDTITIPSLTFVSDAEVVKHIGLNIKFADINKKTLCVDKRHPNLMPTNFAGVLAKGKGKVIDSCHRIEKNDVKNRPDAIWCYSFYATKNMSTVQGGMIVLNDKEKYKWLLMARDHGGTKGTIQRYKGKNPKYDILFPGWRVKGDDMRAAIGLIQLIKLPEMTEKRNEIVKRYNKNLGLNNTGNHLYPIFVNKRKEFIKTMFAHNVQTSIHFQPIHTFTAYKSSQYLPITELVGEHIVSLPLFPDMTKKQVDYVSKSVIDTNLLIKKL